MITRTQIQIMFPHQTIALMKMTLLMKINPLMKICQRKKMKKATSPAARMRVK
ncbi:hypothetical protein DPMN_192403 [Dreissena polymorpha]|uniref:Uncharacterized protein n=1 Tax=Dreissena polymorpha TaxID=45954 RepID=A0A9D4BD22_DREPO|nr:hypothetical protein DPMN_192403 [Dreissena polymorpha]